MSTSTSTAPAMPIASSSSSSSSTIITQPSPITIALRKMVANFIDAQYRIWKLQDKDKIGQLATPEVLEAVKKTSTAFHCDASGGIPLLWLKKDMPLEALKYAEVDYWTDKAGPGPKHEQEEVVVMHGVPADTMETIRRTNDHSLIAHFIYPFIDFWCLVEWHIIIWIACIFCSGTICIMKPTLIVCESSKLIRLFFDNYFIRYYRADITIAIFTLFLEGNFDMVFLTSMCIASIIIIIIIWDDLPISPPDWIHCYGLPIIVQYGPFPEHVAILIPKQDPYRPYHTKALSAEYIEMDRQARAMIELARRIVKDSPPTPTDNTRKAHLRFVRQLIVEEAVRSGIWLRLEEAKRAMRKDENAFKHTVSKAGVENEKAANEAAGTSSTARKDMNIAAGKRAAEVRQATAVRARGAQGSEERKLWVVEVIDDLRRKIEDGRTTQLLACPRTLKDFCGHGTLEHAIWLRDKVSKDADVVNSASGYGQLAPPATEREQDERAKLQDKAGEPNSVPNIREQSPATMLTLLAARPERHTRSYLFVAQCPYCSHEWLLDDKFSHAHHTCSTWRSRVLPTLFEAWTERVKQEQEDMAEKEKASGEEVEMLLPHVTRVSYAGELPWKFGESLADDESWKTLAPGSRKSKPKRVRAKTANSAEPLYIKALDLRGRISRLCFSLHEFKTAAQLLAHPLARSLFVDGKPLPIKGIKFVSLDEFINDEAIRKSLIEEEQVSETLLGALSETPKIWLAVTSTLGATAANRILTSQARLHFEETKMTTIRPVLSQTDIEAAYVERIALRLLRPYEYEWKTGADLFPPPTTASTSSVASTSSHATEAPNDPAASVDAVSAAAVASSSSTSTLQLA